MWRTIAKEATCLPSHDLIFWAQDDAQDHKSMEIFNMWNLSGQLTEK